MGIMVFLCVSLISHVVGMIGQLQLDIIFNLQGGSNHGFYVDGTKDE